MTIPPQFRQDADAFPPKLRGLLEAELAAGNQIAGAGNSFPAPPAGAYLKLAKPVGTRARASGDGLEFRECNCSLYSGWFTDDRGFYYLLEPPLPPPPEPDMDAIRAAHLGPSRPVPLRRDPNSAAGRFEQSMAMNYEKWHDGIGYDIATIAAATPEERQEIEMLLVGHGVKDWRDVEALAALGSPLADEILKAALDARDPEVSMAVVRYAPRLVPQTKRVAALVEALRTAELCGGLSEALAEVAQFHPPEVVEALFRGTLARDGESAVHFAAMLMYVHEKAPAPFDWEQRPFCLRFNTADRGEREAAFVELCGKLGADPTRYL
jgi:hypothetical protein